ncbi:MAG: alanine racemase [Oscillospiraceae bacterium]|jgi:alanine racemase|nr:alanine racemase [Oscillospiraceae bacterium]
MKNLVIDLRVVRNNLRAIKDRAEGVHVFCDLSANAGGMGLLVVAKFLKDEGIRNFVVSDPEDAKLLRESGFTKERIMMLRSTADPNEIAALLTYGVICTAGSYDAAVAINGIAEQYKIVADIQIMIDTGLGCYGFQPTELDKVAAIYNYMSRLNVIGTFTTFSASWRSKKKTFAQLDKFNLALDRIIDSGFEPGAAHIVDSAALFKYDIELMDAVRVDTALTGRIPGKNIPELSKVGFIEAGLEEVGWHPKGHTLGTGRGFVTKAPTKIAILSVGYYHGFSVDRYIAESSLFGFVRWRRRKMFVRVNGSKAKVLGSVGLMHTMIDVTNINCTVGDIAVLDVDPVNVKGLPIEYR